MENIKLKDGSRVRITQVDTDKIGLIHGEILMEDGEVMAPAVWFRNGHFLGRKDNALDIDNIEDVIKNEISSNMVHV